MTTLEMEIALMEHLDVRRNIIVPNVSDWSTILRFEADLLVLTNAGYATCIEIKVSKSDLKNDLKKNHIKALPSKKQFFFGKFKYFYYAVPPELEQEALAQIPDFAGLYVVGKDARRKGRFSVRTARKPKHLFTNKWSDKERLQLLRLGAMRILTLKKNILKTKKR